MGAPMAICIVDAPYLTYRAYCAGDLQSCTNGTLSVALDLLQRHDVCLVWESPDGTGNELRRAILPAYKSRREPKPSEYLEALPPLQDCLTHCGCDHVWPREGEADDAAYTLTVEALAQGRDVLLWGRDKDWYQALALDGGRVRMCLPPTAGLDGGRTIGADDVPGILDVHAYQVPDYLALAGDTADGVPGLPRIGKQRAAALLKAAPRFVTDVLLGRGDLAVRHVVQRDAALAPHAQACADRADLLRQMHEVVVLREVGVTRRPGAFNRAMAAQALELLGCDWALPRLAALGTDEWGAGAPAAASATVEDDWSL